MDVPEAMIHSISRQVIGKMAVALMRGGKSIHIDIEMDLHLTQICNIIPAIDRHLSIFHIIINPLNKSALSK